MFKATGQGTVGETDDTTENALIQQMNPYIRDVICTYYAAQTLVSMMVPGFDEVAKVRVFAAGEENGQVVYVPDEVGQSGASGVKRKAWYEAKIAVLVAGQMAERYLYGPDKVSQFGNLDMREATALACEMVMMHGWSDIGPICVLRADSTEEKYLKGGVNKGNQTAGMDSGRTRGKLWGIPPGKDGTLAEGRKAKYKEEPGLELQMELSDELDMLIANEVRKIFIKACQRAVMIMHDPKGTEMLFTLREARHGQGGQRPEPSRGVQEVWPPQAPELRPVGYQLGQKRRAVLGRVHRVHLGGRRVDHHVLEARGRAMGVARWWIRRHPSSPETVPTFRRKFRSGPRSSSGPYPSVDRRRC